MKKILLLGVLCILSTFTTANAQTFPAVKYSGDINLSYATSTNGVKIKQSNIRTTHGINVNENFFFGMGTGIDMFDIKENNELKYSIPLYANIKGFLPVSQKTKLFLSLDLGESFGIGDINEAKIVFMTPMIGSSFKVGEQNKAINLSMGYNYANFLTVDENNSDGGNNSLMTNIAATSGSFIFRVAFQF